MCNVACKVNTRMNGWLSCRCVGIFFWCVYLTAPPLLAQETPQEQAPLPVTYGTHTTRIFYPASLLSLSDTLLQVDSLLKFVGFVTVPERRDFSYTNLGSLGTATRPLFYEPPKKIGNRSGLTALKPHFRYPEEVKLYNTYSPFLAATGFFGEEGRSNVDFTFARNINPRINLGFSVQNIGVDKQIGPRRGRGDRQNTSVAYQLQGSAFSRDSTYAFYTVFSALKHNDFNQGGSVFDVDTLSGVQFAYRRATPALTEAHGTHNQQALEMLHRLRVLPHTYFYVQGALGKEHFTFLDNLTGNDSLFYVRRQLSDTLTDERLFFSERSAQSGLLWTKRSSYRLYAEKRWTLYEENDIPQRLREQEVYVGSNIRQHLPYKSVLEVDAKVLLGTSYHRLRMAWQLPFLTISATHLFYKPAMMAQYYVGNHHNWSQPLAAPRALSWQLQTAPFTIKDFSIQLQAQAYRIRRYVFYNQEQVPTQMSRADTLLLGHTMLKVRYALFNRHVVFEGRVDYRSFLETAYPALSFPRLQTNGTLYYEDRWFNRSVRVQIGLRYRWHSGYYGFAYQPVLQQFHAQDTFYLPPYMPVDIFFRVQLQNFRMYLQYLHANRVANGGYFATPYYQGERELIDVGFVWALFN